MGSNLCCIELVTFNMKVIIFCFLCMVETLVQGKTLGPENSGKNNDFSKATLAIVQGGTLGYNNSGKNNNVSSNKMDDCKDEETAKFCKKQKKKGKCKDAKISKKCMKTCDACPKPQTEYGCDVEPESKIICKLAAGEKCPDYCCDVENQCYERKGFGTLIQLLNTLQLENTALKTEITKNEANIEINNVDIKANAASIAELEEEVEKLSPTNTSDPGCQSTTTELKCDLPQYANDNFCDDKNNNERCNWDGGACCEGRLFNPNWDKFCTECECLDPCAVLCAGQISSIGNGFCDDINNNKECTYDGGDCCGICINTDFCTNCTCLQNEDGYDKFGPKALKDWIGNGFCDDFLNMAECNFDGGECCGSDVKTDFCENCECHLDSCTNQDLIGDGKCNKKANTAECFFDGGDCCSLCETITVSFYSFFNIFQNTDHTGINGTYNLDSSMTNGYPSWTSTSTSIWHDAAISWIIGASKDIGTSLAFESTSFGNQCPFHLQSVFWNLANPVGWEALPENALKIDCLKN